MLYFGKVKRWATMKLLIVLLLVAALVLLVCMIPVSIRLRYERTAQDDSGELDVRWLYGMVHMKRRLLAMQTRVGSAGPSLRIVHQKGRTIAGRPTTPPTKRSLTTADVLRFVRDLPEWKRFFTQLSPVLRGFLRRVHMERLEWKIRVGTGDVVSCGVTCGAAWAATATVVGAATQLMVFDHAPRLSVEPDFDHARFDTSLDCILRVRAGYAIGAGFRMIRQWRRRHLRGAPDSRTHAHGYDQHP